MSEAFKIVLTSSLTVFGGITVYTLGRIIEKFFVEPIHENRTLHGEIAESLIFYAPVYSNPGTGSRDVMDAASIALRQQASRLLARTQALPWYGLWAALRFVPKREDIIESRKCLIGLSNGVYQGGDPLVNGSWRKQVEKRLRIAADA